MKKIISTVITGAMLFAQFTNVYAAEPSLDFLNVLHTDSRYSNIKQQSEVSFKLNKPIEILDAIDRFDLGGMENHIDLTGLINTLFNSTISLTAESDIKNAGKSISSKVNMQVDSPVRINRNFTIATMQNYDIYVNADISDLENFKFNTVFAMPLADKYITADVEDFNILTQIQEKQNALIEQYNFMPEADNDLTMGVVGADVFEAEIIDEAVEEEIADNTENTEESNSSDITAVIRDSLVRSFDEVQLRAINQKLIDAIYKYANVKGNSTNVTIEFSDFGLKMYIMEIMSIVFDMLDENTKAIYEEAFDEKTIRDFAAKVKLFDEKAMVLKYELNDDGTYSATESEINFNFNIFDIMTVFEADTTGLDRSKSDISFSILEKTKVTYNTAVVNPPETDEENSISIIDMTYPDGYEHILNAESFEDLYGFNDYDDEYFYSYFYVGIDSHFFDDERKLVPLRSLLEGMEYEVNYDNGVITGTTDSKYAEFDTIELTIGSNSIKKDNVAMSLQTAPFVIDGVSYVTLEDAEKIVNSTAISHSYYLTDDYGNIEMERNAQESDFETVH